MRIFLTGATGKLGTPLCQSLVSAGHELIVLTRQNKQLKHGQQHLQYMLWTTNDVAEWLAQIGKIDVIINLAGAGIVDKNWSKKYKQEIIQSRQHIGTLLTEMVSLMPRKPRLFIQASAVGFYGNTLSDEVKTEANASGKDFLAKVCRLWEQSTLPVELQGVRRVIIRTGVVLDKHGALPKIMLPFKLFMGGLLGNGNQYVSWIHYQDWIRAIIHIVQNPSSHGVYNLTAPTPVQFKVLAQIISLLTKRPNWLNLPERLLRLVVGERVNLLTRGQRVVPAKLLAEDFEFGYPDILTAVNDLSKN